MQVHEAAFAAGLTSCSRSSHATKGKVKGGDRFVAVRARGSTFPRGGDVYVPPGTSPASGKPRHQQKAKKAKSHARAVVAPSNTH